MGCPANKVLKGCAGAGLMRDLGKGARNHRGLPEGAPDDAAHGEVPAGTHRRDGELPRAGPDLRGGGRRGRRAPRADGEADVHGPGRLERASRASRRPCWIPVVGNGDVETPEDVVAMFRETGCDAVMCGRATMKNPWIFRQAAELLAGRPYREATLEERRDVILDHFRLIQKDDGGRAEGRPGESSARSPAGTRTACRTGRSCDAASRRSRARRRSSTPSRTSSRPTQPALPREAQYTFGTASFASGLT